MFRAEAQAEVENTYVRHMVVEMEVVVYNGVIDMIELEEVLQRPRPLFVHNLDIVDLNGWNGD